MTASQIALSITIDGRSELPQEVLQALYRITGRSTVELRYALRDSEPVYRAALFGSDHLEVVPRLEKAIDYLDGLGVPVVIHEWFEGAAEPISREVMREIIEAAQPEVG